MRSIYVYSDSLDDSMGSPVVILAALSCTFSIFQHVVTDTYSKQYTSVQEVVE